MNSWRAACAWALARLDAPAQQVQSAEPLPVGITVLLRIASGEHGLATELATEFGVPVSTLQAAAEQALLTQCLYSTAAPARVLALPTQADADLAKEHYRLWMKWLHPDRNPQARDAAERVNVAWKHWQAQAAAPPSPAEFSLHRPAPAGLRSSRRLQLFLAMTAMAALLFGVLAGTDDEEWLLGPEIVGTGMAMSPPSEDAAPLGADWASKIVRLESVAVPRARQSPPGPNPLKNAPMNTPPLVLKSATAVGLANKTMALAPIQGQSSAPSKASPPMASNEAAPVSAADTIIIASEPAHGMPQQAVLQAFSQSYENGDVRAMMHLFASPAILPVEERERIAADYRRVFEKSRARALRFTHLDWQTGGDTVTVTADYVADVQPKLWPATRREQGAMQFHLIEEQGQTRIARLALIR